MSDEPLRGWPEEAGGPLTEGDLFAAFDAVRKQRPMPTMYVMHPQALEDARRAADAYTTVALWADKQLDQLPWWRFGRRRWLRKTFAFNACQAESLWFMFGTGDKAA